MRLIRLLYWWANPSEESFPSRVSCTDNAMWVNISANRWRLAFSENMGFPPVVSEAYKPESEFIHETTAPAVRCSGAYTPLLRIP